MLFNISIFNGLKNDSGIHIVNRIEILKQCSQYGLAYLTAQSNGLSDIAQSIKSQHLNEKEIKIASDLINNNIDFDIPSVEYGPFTDDEKYNWPQLPKEKDLLINQPDVIISNKKKEDKISRNDRNDMESDDDDSVGSQFGVGDGDGDDDDDDEWNTKQIKTDTVEVGNITDDSLQLSDASGEEN